MNRNETTKQMRTALKRRSGKTWSVTGGSGTSHSWLMIDAPPARRTFTHIPKPHNTTNEPGAENWDEVDTGKPGGHTSPKERRELATLLGLDSIVGTGGVSIPASNDYWREYIDRCEGRTPAKCGEIYWD